MAQSREQLLEKKRAYAKMARGMITPERKAELNEGARKRYHANIEQSREKGRLKAQKLYRVDIERSRAKKRANAKAEYAKNPAAVLERNRRSIERCFASAPDLFLARDAAYKKAWLKKNPDARRASVRKYYEANRDAITARCVRWAKNKRAHDPIYRIKSTLRGRLYSLIVKARCGTNDDDARRILLWFEWLRGKGIADWRQKGIAIDHVVPISKFNLENPAAISAANKWSNLFPLSKSENSAKNNRILPDHIRRAWRLAGEFLNERRSSRVA